MLAELIEAQIEEDRAEEAAYYEACNWQDLLEKLRDVLNQLDDNRTSYRRETGESTEEYDRAEKLLYVVHSYMRGRIQELDHDYCENRFRNPYRSKFEYEMMAYARQEGINYVALEEVYPAERRKDVIEYIMETGKASMKYEKTCEAVRDYEREVLGRRRDEWKR